MTTLEMQNLGKSVPSIIQVAVACVFLCGASAQARGEDDAIRKRPHAFQKLQVCNARQALSFDFDAPFDLRTGGSSPLVVVRPGEAVDRTRRFHPTHGVLGLNEPLAWDTFGEMMFRVLPVHTSPLMAGAFLKRYPIGALRPDMMDGAMDYEKGAAVERCEWLQLRGEGGQVPPDSVGIAPYGMIATGCFTLTDAGPVRTLNHATEPRDVNYDITADDECGVTLWMTIDDELMRWTFRGEGWSFKDRLPAKLRGPFLIGQGGRSAIAEHEGHWCRYTPSDAGPWEPRSIVRRDEEPLYLIVDNVHGRDWFLHGRTLLDHTGAAVETLATDLSGPPKLEWLADYIWAQSPAAEDAAQPGP